MALPKGVFKRSAVPSKVPTTSQVDLGEIAINTWDGKLFLKKDNGIESIIEVGGISNVVEDTTPQLGGDLDLNGSDITGTGDISIGGTLSLTTASGSSGNIINATRDGDASSAFTLSRTGVAFRGNASGGNVSFVDYSGYQFYVGVDLQFQMGGHKFSLEDEGTYAWSSTTTAGQTADLTLYRDAANTLALRGGANGGNATSGQTLRVYNTYTDASNYERSYLGWDTNVFKIGVDNAGTGLARPINIVSNATSDTLSPLQINQTWTAGTSVATGITLNITDTSSASTSNLLDLKVGGASKFYIDKSGNVKNPYAYFGNNGNGELAINSINVINLYGGGTTGSLTKKIASMAHNGVFINNNLPLAFNSGILATGDLYLYRDNANVLAQRNGTNQNTFRIYNTWTNSTDNFERGQIGWSTNTLIVGTEKGGVGGTARPLHLQTDGTTRVAVTTDGKVGIGLTEPTEELEVSGDIKATSFIKSGGTSSQYLMADGSVTTGSGSTYYFQSTAPSSPNEGDHWVDNTDGIAYIYYDDGNSSQWIELGPTPIEYSSASGGGGDIISPFLLMGA